MNLRRFSAALSLCLFTILPLRAGAEGDPKNETPTASQTIRIGAGAVDAVTGDMQLHVPLGPKLPGRIPLGFAWAYDNQDSLQSSIGSDMGGSFRPVVWPAPGFGNSTLQTTVMVNGQPYVFYKNYSTAAMPSTSDLTAAMQARHVNLAQTGWKPIGWVISGPGVLQLQALPSSDGTKFLIYAWYHTPADYTDPKTGVDSSGYLDLAPAYVIIDGPNAIWTEIDDHAALEYDKTTRDAVTHFTNLWNDHVSVTETENQEVSGYFTLESIVIKDEITSNTISLAFTKSGSFATKTQPITSPNGITYDAPWRLEGQGTLAVSNSLGLPTVSVSGGFLRTMVRTYDPSNPTSCPNFNG